MKDELRPGSPTVWVVWDNDRDGPLPRTKTHAAGCYVVDPNRPGKQHEYRRIAVADVPENLGRCEICGGGRPPDRSPGRESLRDTAKTRAASDEPLPDDVIAVGRSFRVRDHRSSDEFDLTIVGTGETRPSSGKVVTVSSPVAQALLGHRPGDMVVANTPGGERPYTVLELSGTSDS